jgi:hypothetical protein
MAMKEHYIYSSMHGIMSNNKSIFIVFNGIEEIFLYSVYLSIHDLIQTIYEPLINSDFVSTPWCPINGLPQSFQCGLFHGKNEEKRVEELVWPWFSMIRSHVTEGKKGFLNM